MFIIYTFFVDNKLELREVIEILGDFYSKVSNVMKRNYILDLSYNYINSINYIWEDKNKFYITLEYFYRCNVISQF